MAVGTALRRRAPPAARPSATTSAAGAVRVDVGPRAVAQAARASIVLLCAGVAACASDAPLVLVPGLAQSTAPEGVIAMPTLNGYRYIVPLDDGGAVLFDAGFEPPTSSEQAVLGARPVRALFVTHAHLDHAGGLRGYPGAPLYAGVEEVPILTGARGHRAPLQRVFAALFGAAPAAGRQPLPVAHGEVIAVGALRVTAVHVPGHTAGSTAWHVTTARGDTWLFGGDAVMCGEDGVALSPAFLSDDATAAVDSLHALRAFPFRVLFDGHTGRCEGVWPSVPAVVGRSLRR
jgi:glyoxylase-like metal-dependent hydrolase (beta-lactamase superfamily II)